MMELADVTDSKSVGSDTVWVQVPLPAPFITDNIDIVSKRPAVAGLFDASEPVPQYRSSVDISRGFAVFP